ncbi:hypothetical protein ACXYMX_02980 [Sporosarcina sp. CAU 1771]
MKKYIAMMTIIFASILLTGCISIPLGDAGTLELSEDGISVTPGDATEESEQDAVVEEEVVLEEESAVEDDEKEKEEAEAPKESEDKVDTIAVDKSGTCTDFIEDMRGNERQVKALTKLTPPEFPLTDCTLINSISERTNSSADVVESNFEVQGYWADVYDDFLAYLEQEVDGELTKSENAPDQSAQLKGYDPNYYIRLDFKQHSPEDLPEYVSIYFIIEYYHTPKE